MCEYAIIKSIALYSDLKTNKIKKRKIEEMSNT